MVNTFLPYSSFEQSIQCLDDKRLGKQRTECKQIINALDKYKNEGVIAGYLRHPATLMWYGYDNALKYYHNLCIYEWVNRGKNNTMEYIEHGEVEYPWFIGWDHFHMSHQASLLRKDSQHYSKYFIESPFYSTRGYIWPSHHSSETVGYINDNPHLVDLHYGYSGKPLFASISTTMKKEKQQTLTVKQLRDIAKERGHNGYSRMKKQELMQLLQIQ